MKKIITFLALLPALVLGAPQAITKDAGALTASFTVPTGVSITATGTGTIAATTVTGFSPVSGKVLTLSNSMTLTATDGSTVAFGAGGTVLYSGGSYVSSITGTADQIAASASTGAITLSLAGPHNFSSLTSTAVLLGGGTSAINASDLTYVSPTLTVPDAFAIGSAGSIALTAGGTNENIVLTPSGTGEITSTKAVNLLTESVATTAFFQTAYDSGSSPRTNTNPAFVGRKAGGSVASPATVNAGDYLMVIGGRGYNGSAFPSSSNAAIVFVATETFSGGASGANINFETTPSGSTSRALSLAVSGGPTATLTGGAGNMTIVSGTGNSRTMTFKTTTSGGTATTALTLSATQTATFAGAVTVPGGAAFLTTSTALTDGAGASVATFTNAPAAGNPTKWIGINDNGTTLYIPAFSSP